MDPDDRSFPPLAGDEVTTVRAYLDYHRDTLRAKAAGLDAAGLSAKHPPTTLTLGGLLKHMALVEDWWFGVNLVGTPEMEPFAGIDWDADPDWEFRTAADDSPEVLSGLLDDAIRASDRILDEVGDDLDRRGTVESRHAGTPFDLRWIVCHMIEEYARHNGHADLIREAVDGSTGE